MDTLALLLVAGSLGLNNLAASIAIGLSGIDRAARVRVAIAFGAFEAAMPLVGLLIGHQLAHALGSAAHIVGGLLLIAVGAQISIAAARTSDESPPRIAGAPPGRLLLLAAGLSIDNLVVGFALGAYRAPLAVSVAVITAVSVGLSLLGLELGARLGTRVGHRSEVLSGIVLIATGIAILTNLL
ncbi:MAG: manganese efflux pump MntP family protein [Solirubrobacteraceae bacterium]